MKALITLVVLVASQGAYGWYRSFRCCACPDDNEPMSEFDNFMGFGQSPFFSHSSKRVPVISNVQDLDEDDGADKENSPDDATSSGSLSENRAELLQLHNKYRRKVASGNVNGQPSSSKIHDLKWSTELEASAQNHASRCEFRHDGKSDRATAEWSWVGQNIAYSSSVAQNVKMWFDEYKDYNYRANYCSGVCGHYTQLVWAKTTHVGCGVSKCNFRGYDAVFVVCNYGPGGNFNGERPY